MWWQQKEIWRGHASGFADGGRGLEPRNATLGAGNGFLWIIESKYLTHLMFNMLQPFFFFKETTHFFWLHFSWGNFISLPRKEQYCIALCVVFSDIKSGPLILFFTQLIFQEWFAFLPRWQELDTHCPHSSGWGAGGERGLLWSALLHCLALCFVRSCFPSLPVCGKFAPAVRLTT